MESFNKFWKECKLSNHGEILLRYGKERELPEKGGTFKVKGGKLVVLPIERVYGSGLVYPCGAEVVRRKGGLIIVRQWSV